MGGRIFFLIRSTDNQVLPPSFIANFFFIISFTCGWSLLNEVLLVLLNLQIRFTTISGGTRWQIVRLIPAGVEESKMFGTGYQMALLAILAAAVAPVSSNYDTSMVHRLMQV